jgi:hypothetical protein
MIKLKDILKEIKNDVHHTVAGYPEKSADDEQLPANVDTEKHFTTTEPSKPTVHTKPEDPHNKYAIQHNMSVTPQSAAETGTPYYIHQDYVNLLRQIYNKTLFKTKSQHEAERILQSAMKSDYYKDSILKKYHDRIEMERARIGREKSAAEAEKIQQAVEDALEKAEEKVSAAVNSNNSTSNFYSSEDPEDRRYHYFQDRDTLVARQEWEKNHHDTPFPYNLKPSRDIGMNDIKTRAYQQQVIQYLKDNP